MDWNTIFITTVEASIGWQTVAYALAAIGINIQFGYAGLLNFGQAAFLGVAAYGLAVTVSTFHLSFWLGIAIGLVATVILAFLLGIPTLRLRADYLAIVTIAAAEIVRLVFRSVAFKDVFGGSDGRQNFSGDFFAINPYSPGTYGIGPISFDERTTWVLTVGWILIALSCALVYLLMKSPWGRVMKAIREDEDAVRSLGKNVFSYKMQALVLGGVIGCLGGFIFALSQASVQPDLFGTEFTFYAYTIVILGGAARVFSPVVGAAIFWVLLVFIGNTLDEAARAGAFGSWVTVSQVGSVRFMLVGLGLMLLLIFRPQGIFGDKREIALDAR
ncbi:branched-chain amino acid ABC transporter permease [Planotetraspora kaengkrachanensis]|uniref:Branched-chain amino acid ABC transporter permease n=1 Tax=Planotetraspora kaengkrachanensis TaxID=575193 RepID=A0A8J3PRB5_9ACTN|nr:branched-chain amino acid ABC transporter permease [Planotetraspora kaengkrachanensis]GIG76946.1 branched-chain amino acid ABC transporter permease [Planotetraspora kaengkrachanensis]